MHEQNMRQKLETALVPSHYELVNESHMHSVPQNSETHFRLVVVSQKFQGLSRVQRSRLLHELFAHELQNGVHAFSHFAYTPEEWAARSESPGASPLCASKKASKGSV